MHGVAASSTGAGMLSPRATWCFRAETYVGHISQVGHSISMGTSGPRICFGLARKYRIMMHLFLTREGFPLGL